MASSRRRYSLRKVHIPGGLRRDSTAVHSTALQFQNLAPIPSRLGNLEFKPSDILPSLSDDENDTPIHVSRPASLEFKPSDILPTLSDDEKDFFRLVNSGDLETVARMLDNNRASNINSQDYQGYTALTLAVKNEDIDMVNLLLSYDSLKMGDSLLHATVIGNKDIVEIMLDWQSQHRGSEKSLVVDLDSADFSPDLTPLIVAAHYQHYDVIKMLLARGHTIHKPHSPDCMCKERCRKHVLGESLVDSKGRYNTYKALASPVYMSLSSPDPIYTAFVLSKELVKMSNLEREFKNQYLELSGKCSQLAVDLLDRCRTSEEVAMLLNKKVDVGTEFKETRFSRVRLAVETDQKQFVAHSNCQQVLRTAWLGAWQDWRSFSYAKKFGLLIPRGLLLPLLAIVFWTLPRHNLTKSWRSPMNKFYSFAASYILFIVLLTCQCRLDLQDFKRGFPDTGLEFPIILYILGFLSMHIRQIWMHGIQNWRATKWNEYDMIMIMCYFMAFIYWYLAWADVRQNGNMWQERKYWKQNDPTLMAEAFLSVAAVLSWGKLLYFFQIGSLTGPLQINLGRILPDIAIFLTVFMVVMCSFAAGISKLYPYYHGQIRVKDGVTFKQSNAFTTYQETLKSLFWTLFGLSPPQFAEVIIGEYPVSVGNETFMYYNYHLVTEHVGFTLFGIYNVLALIILVNMLIAMMSTSFQDVQNNRDQEWKFARTRVWMSFIDPGGTLPPPFNLVPSPISIYRLGQWFVCCAKGDHNAKFSKRRGCYMEDKAGFVEEEEEEGNYQVVIGQLVQRYLSHRDQSASNRTATTNDLDFLRYDLNDLKLTLRSKKIEDKTSQHSDLEDSVFYPASQKKGGRSIPNRTPNQLSPASARLPPGPMAHTSALHEAIDEED